MYDIVAFGELLVDFVMVDVSEQGNPVFERNPGGGPANMICAAAKMGAKTAFLSKVGDDMFGQALKKVIHDQGVDDSQILLSKEQKTTLAFVQLSSEGERSFSFYRKNHADTCMRFDEFDPSVLNSCKYFFFSSVLMAEGSSRKATFDVVDYAKGHGATVIYDPNLRFNLWESELELCDYVKRGFAYADIVKVAEEELLFLMDGRRDVASISMEDINNAVDRLLKEYPISVVLVTMGGKGCVLVTREAREYVKGFFVEKPVDTTAAGDSFSAGFTSHLVSLNQPWQEMDFSMLRQAVLVGNAVGSLTVQKKGAISALPSKEEVNKVMNQLK